MTTEETTETLDVTRLNCPMPVVKTKQAFDDLAADEVLAIHATDPGSVSDIAGWTDGTDGAELLDQDETEVDGETIYRHYVRRAA